MKILRIHILLPIFCLISAAAFSQNVNWKRLDAENPNLVQVALGLDFGTTASVGYGRLLGTKRPILLSADFAVPFGMTVLDDFKTRAGGQMEVWRSGNFSATLQASGVFRRFESSIARIASFGSETGGVFGFYKSKWYVATEFAFDKAISTHLKHSEFMREVYPEIRDGWYVPTGGNFSYGLQTGLSFGKNDLHLSVGKVLTEDFKTTPTIPFYLQIGFNRRF